MASAKDPSQANQNGGIEVIQGSPSASAALTYALMRERSRSSARKKKSTSLTYHPPTPPQRSSHNVVRTQSCEISAQMSEASTLQINNQESKKLSYIKMPPKQPTAEKPLSIPESKEVTTPKRLTTKKVKSPFSNKTDTTEFSTSDEGSTGKTKKGRKKKIFGSVRNLLRRNSSSKSSKKVAAKEKVAKDDAPYDEVKVAKDDAPYDEVKVAKDDVPYDEIIDTEPAFTPTFVNLGGRRHSADKSAVDHEGTPEKTKVTLKKAKLYASKSKQLLITLEQDCKNNPTKEEQDEEAEREKRMKDLKRAKLALGYVREAQRLYDLLESTKVQKGSFAIESSPERALSPLSSILAEVGKQPPAVPNKPTPMERVDDAPTDISIASSSGVEQAGNAKRDSSSIIHPPLMVEVESTISDGEALLLLERKHQERKLNKLQLFSLPQDFMECGGGLRHTLSNESEDFEINSITTDQEYDKMIQELEHYPTTFTAAVWQPIKDGMEAATARAQERMDMSSSSSEAAAASSQELTFQRNDRVISTVHTFDLQHLGCAALTMTRSSADDSDSDDERDKYYVDHVNEFTARSVAIMSDGSCSEVREEIEVIDDGSEATSHYGSDTSSSEAGFEVLDGTDDSEATSQYGSDASSGEIDDSDDSEATSRCESDSSCSELQEEIEVFEESDYSDVSSNSKYSTCSSDSSEVSVATTVSEKIAREIRSAKRIFGFFS